MEGVSTSVNLDNIKESSGNFTRQSGRLLREVVFRNTIWNVCSGRLICITTRGIRLSGNDSQSSSEKAHYSRVRSLMFKTSTCCSKKLVVFRIKLTKFSLRYAIYSEWRLHWLSMFSSSGCGEGWEKVSCMDSNNGDSRPRMRHSN